MKNLELFYSISVKSPSGIVLSHAGACPAHSFCKSFSQLLFNVGFGAAFGVPAAVTDTGGSSVTLASDMGYAVNAAITVTTYGIQVGTGTGTESINDTAIGTLIAHGTGAGQLQYGAVTFGAPSTTATTTTFRITRVFTNGSAGAITVQEITLVGRQTGGAPAASFLLVRDLTGAVSVGVGAQLTVNYNLTTTI